MLSSPLQAEEAFPSPLSNEIGLPHSANDVHTEEEAVALPESGVSGENHAPPNVRETRSATPIVNRSFAETSGTSNFQEMANSCIIHLTKPIENIPSIGPEELKVIGRCIMFDAETLFNGEVRNMRYSGLVASICFDTVTLIHARRFSDSEFEEFLKVKAAADRRQEESSAGSPREEMTGQTNEEYEQQLEESTCLASDEVGDNQQLEHDEGDGLQQMITRSSPKPGSPTGSERRTWKGEAEDFTAPFVTFSRKRIHNVQFSIDPPSSFYSLFRDPAKHFFDMQCLRMFCRRYVVHTSQGNNPRNVPLKAFIVCRCNCPQIDDELLIRVTREEIVYLFKLDAEIKRMTAQMPRPSPREENIDTGVLSFFAELEARQRMLRRYSQDTILIGVVEIFLVCLVLLIRYSLWSEVEILHEYFRSVDASCRMFWVLTACLGLMTTAHGRMILTPSEQERSFRSFRFLFALLALFSCLLMMNAGVKSLSTSKLRVFMANKASRKSFQLMDFYHHAYCSGFDVPCVGSMLTTSPFCAVFSSVDDSLNNPSSVPCAPFLRAEVQRTLVPLLTLGLGSLFLFLVDVYSLVRHASRI